MWTCSQHSSRSPERGLRPAFPARVCSRSPPVSAASRRCTGRAMRRCSRPRPTCGALASGSSSRTCRETPRAPAFARQRGSSTTSGPIPWSSTTSTTTPTTSPCASGSWASYSSTWLRHGPDIPGRPPDRRSSELRVGALFPRHWVLARGEDDHGVVLEHLFIGLRRPVEGAPGHAGVPLVESHVPDVVAVEQGFCALPEPLSGCGDLCGDDVGAPLASVLHVLRPLYPHHGERQSRGQDRYDSRE